MKIEIVPVTWAQAVEFVARYHRHHGTPRGGKFAVGAMVGTQLVGVITVGRPVARHLDDGFTAEVNRCCTDGTANACSALYGAAWRVARAMGYRRLITYTLATEPGTSLRAAGWTLVGARGGGSWSRPSRPRVDAHPTVQKTLWEVAA